MGWIKIGKQKCLVDDTDLPMVKQQAWCVHHGYAATNLNGKTVYMHRMLLPLPKGTQVDHKNGNKLDNRQRNLRPATPSQNRMNKPLITGRNTSGFKGVSRRRDTGKYRASIGANGR